MIVKRNVGMSRQRSIARAIIVARRAGAVQLLDGRKVFDPRGRTPQDIGKRIERARRALRLTQEQFARGIHKSQGACAGWETGLRPPGMKIANALCDVYGLTLDYIYRGDTSAIPQTLLLTLNKMKPNG
jgi:DNA-binding XRE family transcriptional regulator